MRFSRFPHCKGGAGFLQLNELVECCHIAENVFDILRKGERRVDCGTDGRGARSTGRGQQHVRRSARACTDHGRHPELLAALARLAEPAGGRAAPVPK
jgi:two-component system chemotaxis sensor kinase CheA